MIIVLLFTIIIIISSFPAATFPIKSAENLQNKSKTFSVVVNRLATHRPRLGGGQEALLF